MTAARAAKLDALGFKWAGAGGSASSQLKPAAIRALGAKSLLACPVPRQQLGGRPGAQRMAEDSKPDTDSAQQQLSTANPSTSFHQEDKHENDARHEGHDERTAAGDGAGLWGGSFSSFAARRSAGDHARSGMGARSGLAAKSHRDSSGAPAER
jgi:hypothetical protein